MARQTAHMLNFELAGKFGWDFIKELAAGFEKSMDDKEEKCATVFLCYMLVLFDKDEMVDFIQAFVMHNPTYTGAFVEGYIAESIAIIKNLEEGKFYDC